jgi:hypothetical protein
MEAGPSYCRKHPDVIALAINNISMRSLLAALLTKGNVASANRIAGAMNAMKLEAGARDIIGAMQSAGYAVKASNPFDAAVPDIRTMRPVAPHAGRLELLWNKLVPLMEADLLPPLDRPVDFESALSRAQEVYVHNAYHSLSIEGYRVTEELINRVRKGDWNPEDYASDREQLDAMAAKGYSEAHSLVIQTIRELHAGRQNIRSVATSLSAWYRELFGPMVRAGMYSLADLAGYRNRPLFIRGSRHTPLPAEILLDAMDVMFERAESTVHPPVRAALCHWCIGYIHPFPDGNGRIARFFMNALLVSSGYPWTVIRIETRTRYMAALEALSVHHDPIPFLRCVRDEMRTSERI